MSHECVWAVLSTVTVSLRDSIFREKFRDFFPEIFSRKTWKSLIDLRWNLYLAEIFKGHYSIYNNHITKRVMVYVYAELLLLTFNNWEHHYIQSWRWCWLDWSTVLRGALEWTILFYVKYISSIAFLNLRSSTLSHFTGRHWLYNSNIYVKDFLLV